MSSNTRLHKHWVGIALFCSVAIDPVPGQAADALPACAHSIGRVVSLQGKVELRRGTTQTWTEVRQLDLPLCSGDVIHTGSRSRAGVVLSPGTVVRIDQNSTVLMRDQGADVQVEMFKDAEFAPEQVGKACGAGYFITRFPKKFKVYTPFLNAAVEGTEFQLALACDRADLSVYEGRVAAEHLIAQQPRLILESGQSLSADGGDAPGPIRAIVRQEDSVQWALYYPALADQRIAAHLPDCSALSADERPACLLSHIEDSLRAGRVDVAGAQLSTLREVAPLSPDAQALSSIIALVKNDKAQALQLAQRALEYSDQSTRAWLALSYAQQAHFKLESALEAAERAAALAPDNALIQARVAELLLSLGETRKAETTARLATRLNVNESRAYTVLGYVQLARINIAQAKQDFSRAIELDSVDPLPRLGLGLATIRTGKLAEGREHIEIAVALDPANSLIRSYAGKAYFEENTAARDGLAASQFDLAKKLDPQDPTPHYYQAILNQSLNLNDEALAELHQSIAKNDNRQVNRSRLLLDQDNAARNVTLASVYKNMGEEQRAFTSAASTLLMAPTNAGAHNVLGSVTSILPRREAARSAELLQSSMLDLNAMQRTPTRLAFSDFDSWQPNASLPSGTSEYSELFERNRLAFEGIGALGNHDTRSTDLAVIGTLDNFHLRADYFSYKTDGYRRNNDLEQEIGGLKVGADVNRNVSIQTEVRQRRVNGGDVGENFAPSAFTEDRDTVDEATGRIGIRVSNDDRSLTTLMSLIASDRTARRTIRSPGAPIVDSYGNSSTNQVEAQLLGSMGMFSLTAGGGVSRQNSTTTDSLDFTPLFGIPCPFPTCDTSSDSNTDAHNLYAYTGVRSTPWLQSLIGISHDSYREGRKVARVWNPKLGLDFHFPSVRFRLAAFNAFKRPITSNQTLEPTQVLGFVQFFDDLNATRSRNLALGVDGSLGDKVSASAQWQRRFLKILGLNSSGDPLIERWNETTASTDIALRATSDLRFGLRGLWETWRGNWEDNLEIRTKSLELGAHYAMGGLTAGASATYVRQHLERTATSLLPEGDSSFTTVDLHVTHLLPRRHGSIALEVRNVFDREFAYQDDDFRTAGTVLPRYTPSRTLLLVGRVMF